MYVIPIKNAASTSHPILPESELAMFANIDVMANISRELLKGITKRASEWDQSGCDIMSLRISDVMTTLVSDHYTEIPLHPFNS